MNNCLVTKLKATVNNEDLSKLNVLTIKTKASDSPTVDTQWITIGASENGSVSINSSSVGLYKSGISGELWPYPYTVFPNAAIGSHFENKDGVIEITGKYNINTIGLGSNTTLRMKEIYGIPATLISFNTSGSIEEEVIDATKLSNAFKRSEISYIRYPADLMVINGLNKNTAIEFTKITFINDGFCKLFDNIGLDDLANKVNITSINAPFLNAGNLSSLAKLTNLTTIVFTDNKQNSGDIMDFINPWIQAGRTSGKINVSCLLPQKNITLNGQPISYPSGVTDANAYLNWTSDGTVTFTAS